MIDLLKREWFTLMFLAAIAVSVWAFTLYHRRAMAQREPLIVECGKRVRV